MQPATSGFIALAGNALSNCLLPTTLFTQMTLALLQKLVMALRANEPDGYKVWLEIRIKQLGDAASEIEPD